jgi:aminoglycoside 3-N-acetyltransferase
MRDWVSVLAANWRASGLTDGDTVLVHSSLRRTLGVIAEPGMQDPVGTVLRSFREAVGPAGTLLLPLFNFDFTKGVPFDMRTTPSQMGALTEAARNCLGAVRTGHPIYSFAVLGGHAERFRDVVNQSGYGADSPFARLRELGGKIAVLDLRDQHSMTFYHHVEEMLDVPYRFHKAWTGAYTDMRGETSNREFSLFVRNLEQRVETDVDRMGELLWSKGLYAGSRPGVGSGLRVISADDLFQETAAVIRRGHAKHFLYSIRKGD